MTSLRESTIRRGSIELSDGHDFHLCTAPRKDTQAQPTGNHHEPPWRPAQGKPGDHPLELRAQPEPQRKRPADSYRCQRQSEGVPLKPPEAGRAHAEDQCQIPRKERRLDHLRGEKPCVAHGDDAENPAPAEKTTRSLGQRLPSLPPPPPPASPARRGGTSRQKRRDGREKRRDGTLPRGSLLL